MANIINIQADEFVQMANKLQKVGRADLPVAIRSTLNNLAFDMKGQGAKRGEIDKTAEKEFEYRRNKTLFRAMTGVRKATGLTIPQLSSEAGINKRSGRNKLAEGLADQVKGGKTEQKATPLKPARTGKNYGRKVRKKFLIGQIDSAIPIKEQRGKRFTQLAIRAMNTGRPVLITGKRGDNYIAYVKSMRRNNNKVEFDMDWKYRINRDGTVNLSEKHPYIERAARITGRKMSKEFVIQANKRINKSLIK